MYKGIWQHKEIRESLEFIKPEFYQSLDEGDTPTNKFLDENNNKIIIKREDLNPTGSWKDRASALKISQLLADKQLEAVIVSSGNAAISLLTYANSLKQTNFKLHVVVSPQISQIKKETILSLVNAGNHEIYFDKNAKKLSVQISTQRKIPLLKTSIDEDLLKAYWSLGFEIFKDIKHEVYKNNILVASASSGTALVGLTQGLFSKLEDESKMPKVFAIQTESCHPLSEDSSNSQSPEDIRSLADSIVDKSMLRKPQIEKILLQTGGKSFAISNKELLAAKDYAKDIFELDLSYTSLLSIAAYLKVKDKYHNSNFILVTSGR